MPKKGPQSKRRRGKAKENTKDLFASNKQNHENKETSEKNSLEKKVTEWLSKAHTSISPVPELSTPAVRKLPADIQITLSFKNEIPDRDFKTFNAELGGRSVVVEEYPSDHNPKSIKNAMAVLESEPFVRKLLCKSACGDSEFLVFEKVSKSLKRQLAEIGLSTASPQTKPVVVFQSFCRQMVSAFDRMHKHKIRKYYVLTI